MSNALIVFICFITGIVLFGVFVWFYPDNLGGGLIAALIGAFALLGMIIAGVSAVGWGSG